jgi:hypothetical protein
MTPQQFTRALDDLGVTSPGLARLLRLNPTTTWRWEQNGCNDVRTVVLLKLLIDGRITFKDIEARAK